MKIAWRNSMVASSVSMGNPSPTSECRFAIPGIKLVLVVLFCGLSVAASLYTIRLLPYYDGLDADAAVVESTLHQLTFDVCSRSTVSFVFFIRFMRGIDVLRLTWLFCLRVLVLCSLFLFVCLMCSISHHMKRIQPEDKTRSDLRCGALDLRCQVGVLCITYHTNAMTWCSCWRVSIDCHLVPTRRGGREKRRAMGSDPHALRWPNRLGEG